MKKNDCSVVDVVELIFLKTAIYGDALLKMMLNNKPMTMMMMCSLQNVGSDASWWH